MIGIEQISNKIAIFLADNIQDRTQISQIVSARRHKEYKLLNKQEVIDIFQYGLEGLLGEIVKTIIIITISVPLHILLPAIFIMLSFCVLRLLAGGVHMDNYTKCLSTGSVLFLVPAWFIQHYNDKLYLIDIGLYSFIILILAFIDGVYAPVESVNKPIKEDDKIIYKLKSMIYVLIIGLIITIINNNIIKFSLLIGIILEIFTITPTGIKLFNNVENLIDKIFIIIKNIVGKVGDK